jgi:hypothetical protein
LHNTWGIFLLERIFGATITNSDGRLIPTRFIGEQHVKEDLGRIPTVQDWLEFIVPKPWMLRKGKPLGDPLRADETPTCSKPIDVVVNIHGGMVQDICCRNPELRVIVVDWDNAGAPEDDPRFVNVASDSGREQVAYVADYPVTAFLHLTGTDVERALCLAGISLETTADVQTPTLHRQEISSTRSTLTVAELVARLERLSQSSPWGRDTCVCICLEGEGYLNVTEVVIERDPDGAVILLKPLCGNKPNVHGDLIENGPSQVTGL